MSTGQGQGQYGQPYGDASQGQFGSQQSGGQQYGTPPPASSPPEKKPGGNGSDLFSSAGGTPANALVILGLFLVLLATMIPDCRTASARATIAEFREAEALVDFELDQFREQQQRQVQAAMSNPGTPAPNSEQLQAAVTQRREQLRNEHEVNDRRRKAIEAGSSVQGMWGHMVINWIGRFLLILGLLMMTLRASGTKQIVLVAVLLVVMFSSLSGVRLDFGAEGRLGSGDTQTQRAPELDDVRDRR